MKINYFAPSYKRPYKSSTQKLYPQVKLVVMESEAEDYRRGGNDIIICPDGVQGNICRVRNWIINEQMKDNDAIIIIDDDNSGIGRWDNLKWIMFNAEELEEFCEQITLVCKDFGFKTWGLNCLTDKGAYREHTPFSTQSFVGAPFQCILKGNRLRYDEKLPLKEDYDFTLQNIKQYRGILRVNFASYKTKQSEQTGGCANMRNMKKEKEQFDLLQRKWGSKLVKLDTQSKKLFDYNPIIRSPILGV